MKLFILPNAISEGIFTSQVVPLLRESSQRCDTLLVVNKTDHVPGDLRLNTISYRDARRLTSDVEMIYVRDLRSYVASLFLRSNSKKTKTFYDIRGLEFAQSYLRRKSLIRKSILFHIEKWVMNRADFLGCVSNNMAEYVASNMLRKGSPTTSKIFVTPCCIDASHKQPALEWNSTLRFVYSGSIKKWQCFDRVLSLYANVSKHFDCSLTVFTKDVGIATEAVAEANLEVDVRSLTRDQVLQELPTFDFGFLIRENSLVNRVASPVKFLEYTSCGVVPIMTQHVGDYSKLVAQEGAGIVLNNNEGLAESIECTVKSPKPIKKLAYITEQYSWDKYLDSHPVITYTSGS